MQPLLTQFQTYLTGSKQLSDSSIKNYVSDINHFFNFLTTKLKLKQNTIEPKHITPAICQKYQQSLQTNISAKTNTVPVTTGTAATTKTNIANTTNIAKASIAKTNAVIPVPTGTSATNALPVVPTGTAATTEINPTKTTNIPASTINRRLSSLRCFGNFLQAANKLNSNPTQAISSIIQQPNLNQIINRYQQYLNKQKLSPITIKNYLSDLKIYLLWAQQYVK